MATAAVAAVSRAAASAAPPTPPRKKMSLTAYTEQCMARCRTDAELEQMRAALHARITEAIAKNQVTQDWSDEPPPMVLSPPPAGRPGLAPGSSNGNGNHSGGGIGSEWQQGGFHRAGQGPNSQLNPYLPSDGSSGGSGGSGGSGSKKSKKRSRFQDQEAEGGAFSPAQKMQAAKRAGRFAGPANGLFRDAPQAATVTTSAAERHAQVVDLLSQGGGGCGGFLGVSGVEKLGVLHHPASFPNFLPFLCPLFSPAVLLPVLPTACPSPRAPSTTWATTIPKSSKW
jgi:hypothetical protein